MESIIPPPSQSLLHAALSIEAPAYIIDESALERNLQILREVADQSGAKIVLAQKAFAQPQLYPLIGEYLDGACASGAWEAQLAKEFLPEGSEVITCSPAYNDDDIEALLPISHHLDFNSISQWVRYRELCLDYREKNSSEIQFGLRINPECSTGDTPLYDPCAIGSRLGVTAAELKKVDCLDGISGLHFHTLCEQGLEDLEITVQAVESSFGDLLSTDQIKYLNLGGGHWITKDGYDREGLISLIKRLTETYRLQVYLEPGEAVAIHSGVLVATVLDLHKSGEIVNAILDISATAHMPDVLEMPYRPDVYRVSCGSEALKSGESIYRLTGNTCLAGDQIGDYAFNTPLKVGDRLCFNDMAHYTVVKTTFFNGVKHPSIQLLKADGGLEILKEFKFEDYLGLKRG